MYDADSADADHMRESGARAWMLTVAGFVAQLGGDLADLAEAGGPDRVAHREQSAGGADGDAAADVELAVLECFGGVAGGADSHRLGVEQLLDGERVVQLDDIEFVGGDAGV